MMESKLKRIRYWCALVLAGSLGAFHIYTAFFGALENMKQRPIHLAMVLGLGFLVHPMFKKGKDRPLLLAVDLGLVAVAAIIPYYLYVIYPEIPFKAGSPTAFDIWLACATVFLVLYATWRVIGSILPGMAIFFLLYAYLGPWFPPIVAHGGFSFESIVGLQLLTGDGIFGIPLGVAATYVVLFIFFGAFLQASGAGDFFIDLGNALMGKYRGGPAKIAVVASALFGTISGSPTANVMGVGVFTIPLMKKVGYRPVFAGAVENVASVGGMIMPPVMGASAFIMAEVLGKPYTDVCIAAALPAVLYYLALFFSIDMEAVKENLKGIPKEQLPRLSQVLSRAYYLLPVFILIYTLVIVRESPMKAGVWAIVGSLAIGFLGTKQRRWNWKKFSDAVLQAGRQTLIVSLGCACVGVIIGSLMQTGLSMKLSSIIVELSMGKLFLIMLLNMIVSLILGMALPAVACYIILAVFGAPSLIEAGVPPMAAHLFILYFGVISDITPPVGFSAYAAGALAEADPMRIMVTACRIGLAGFIIPFAFATNPAFLLEGSAAQIALAILSGVVAAWAVGAGVIGYLFRRMFFPLRVLLILAAFCIAVEVPLVLKIIAYGYVAALSGTFFMLARIRRPAIAEKAFGG